MLKRLILRALAIWRTRQSGQIPYAELQAKHLERLKTIVNRETLLEYLPKQGVVAEAGVFKGDFSQMILDKCQPKQLYLIDVWAGKEGQEHLEQVKNRFSKEIQNGQVIVHQGQSTTVLKEFPGSNFDWIYLDTDHTYQTTAAELKLSTHVLKNDGLILGHDYVTGNWNGGVRYGVVEAVNEFCLQNDWEFVFLTAETHRHLSFGIKRVMSDER
jgi:predicted O-methyltransferase YrrM